MKTDGESAECYCNMSEMTFKSDKKSGKVGRTFLELHFHTGLMENPETRKKLKEWHPCVIRDIR